jgi:hypothetical protein
MSLTWGGIKRLVRLQAVAEQLASIARRGEQTATSRDYGGRIDVMLDDLMNEAHDVLQDADPALAEEFERIVTGRRALPLSLAVRASVLAGWLRGAVEAETLEVHIRMGDDRPRLGKLVSSVDIGG